MLSASRSGSQITIDDLNLIVRLAQFYPPRTQGVLQVQTFLIADHLVWAGLANVNERLAVQVLRLD